MQYYLRTMLKSCGTVGRVCPHLFKLLCNVLVLRLGLNQGTQLPMRLELVVNFMLQPYACLSGSFSHCLSISDPAATACRLMVLMLLHTADAEVNMAYRDSLWAHRISSAVLHPAVEPVGGRPGSCIVPSPL